MFLSRFYCDSHITRALNHLSDLDTPISTFPTENALNTDVFTILDKIRSKFKMVTSLLVFRKSTLKCQKMSGSRIKQKKADAEKLSFAANEESLRSLRIVVALLFRKGGVFGSPQFGTEEK